MINKGAAAFDFTCALHTYFAVADVSDASVVGLQGCRYLDSLENRVEKVDDGKDVTFSQEVRACVRACVQRESMWEIENVRGRPRWREIIG